MLVWGRGGRPGGLALTSSPPRRRGPPSALRYVSSGPRLRGGDGDMRTAAHPKRLFSGAHLLFEILDARLEEAFGCQPVLVGADQKRGVLGTFADLQRPHTHLFENFG